MIDLEAFEERAAICEFDGGMSRFRAETLAAAEQGKTRWEVIDAKRGRDTERGGDHRPAMAGQSRQNDMPGVQSRQAEENGPLSEREPTAGRAGVVLPSLRNERGAVL